MSTAMPQAKIDYGSRVVQYGAMGDYTSGNDSVITSASVSSPLGPAASFLLMDLESSVPGVTAVCCAVRNCSQDGGKFLAAGGRLRCEICNTYAPRHDPTVILSLWYMHDRRGQKFARSTDANVEAVLVGWLPEAPRAARDAYFEDLLATSQEFTKFLKKRAPFQSKDGVQHVRHVATASTPAVLEQKSSSPTVMRALYTSLDSGEWPRLQLTLVNLPPFEKSTSASANYMCLLAPTCTCDTNHRLMTNHHGVVKCESCGQVQNDTLLPLWTINKGQYQKPKFTAEASAIMHTWHRWRDARSLFIQAVEKSWTAFAPHMPELDHSADI